MKKTVMVEFEKSEIEDLDWNQGRRATMHKFLDSYRVIGQFIGQQIYKGNEEPKKMILGIEIWRGVPMKRGIKVIIDKGSLDKIEKYQRIQVVTKMFLCAYTAIGELCVERICRGKSEPRKIVVRVEVN